MILINFIWVSFILFEIIKGNPDPFTFLVSNNFGQLSLESPTHARVLVDGLISPNAFDYSFNDKLVFYVGGHQMQHTDFIPVIKAFNLTDFRAHNIYKFDHSTVNALAVDWHNMMIYWADFKEEYIAVGEVNLDLITITKQKIIVSTNISNLKSICVDPVSRSLFWLRSEESTLIESSGLDGSERKVIFEEPGIMGRDLKVDRSTKRLVWFDETHNRFGCCNYEGGDITYIPTPNLGPNRPQLLTAFGGRIFFFNDMSISSVLEKDKISLSTKVHRRFGHQLYAAMVFSGADQTQVPVGGNFTCVPEKFRHLTNAGETGCNFLCLSSPSKPQYTCTCPTGISSSNALSSPISMKGESKISLSHSYMCPKNPEKFLLVARPPKIFMLSLDRQLTDSPLWPIGTSPNPRGTLVRVDFDPKSDYIYWVDNAIYRLKLGEQTPSIVIEPTNGALQTLDGLAVDWVVGNLYWSTGGNRQIWVSRLDGAWPRLLLTLEDFDAGDGSSVGGDSDKESADIVGDAYSEETNKRRPTALAIDPINRYLFFNVWSGTRGRIERTWLDGTHREVIVDHNHTVWPNGIALDFEARHLYYVDAYLGVISRVDYSGTNPKQIVSGHLQHPFGFDLLGNNLYWSDWQTLSISQINKQTGEDLRVLKTIGVDEALMGIRAVDLSAKNTYTGNVCGDKSRSGCSHLCFMLPSQEKSERSSNSSNKPDEVDGLYYCACPPEYALDSDGKTCVVPDSMLLYSLHGTGIRRMSLPKSRQKHPSYGPFMHHPGNDRQPPGTTGVKANGLTSHDVELAAAETAAMASNQIFNQVPLPFLHRVIRFDVHISEERIYWVEESAPQCISVAFLNGTGKETLLCLFHDTVVEELANRTGGNGMGESDTSQPISSENPLQARDSIVGLALDWLTNALYFCVVGERPRLEVIDLKYRSYLPPLSSNSDGSPLPLYSPPVAPQLPSQRGARPRKPPTASRSWGNWHSSLRVRRSIVPPWFLPPKSADPIVDAYDPYSYDFNPVTDRLANSVDNYRLVLLHNLSSPRDIVVHPKKRYVFWLDGTHNARFNIFTAGLDGRNHRLIWNGVGIVMSLAIDYTADRLYWMNWETKCIESITLNGEDWFSVNPQLPSDHGTLRNSDDVYDDSVSPPSTWSSDFHPYAIDVFQGAVLFSELTTQSVYRVQIPNTRSNGNQFNVAADLLLRGAASPSGRQNFLVLGLFVAGFDRQAAEPGHRCAPPSSNMAFYPQPPAWNYPYNLQNPPNHPQHQQTGPICQALCLGAPSPHSAFGSRGSSAAQQSVFRGRGGVGGGYPPSPLDDRSPRFTCACPTQFTLASDGYSCLEPHRSLLIVTADGSITRYTPDDQPATNLLTLSPLTLPTHDQLSADAPPPTWQPVEQVTSPYAATGGSDSTLNEGDLDALTDPLVFARRWTARHRVAAAALEGVTNAGLFFLLQPVGRRDVVSSPGMPLNSSPRAGGRNFRHNPDSVGRNGATRDKSFTEKVRLGMPFLRLGFLEFATGEVTLWEGGPLVLKPESGWDSFIPSGGGSNSDSSTYSQNSNTISLNRPRWSLAFDPVNQIVFWSDAITGLIGAENSRSGRTIGLVANLTENSRTVLEIVVEPRSGQLFQLTSKQLEAKSQPTECRIEVTYLDGSDRRIIYDASKSSSCPHSLAYSAKLTKIFWVDPNKKRIHSISVVSTLGRGILQPETVVLDVSPVPKSLVILPESGMGSPSSSNVLRLTWLEPINHDINFGSKNHPTNLLYVPLDPALLNAAPIVAQKPHVPPPGLNSLLNCGSQLFLVPVRGGGLGDLSWHPCAGPSHGECSQFCLPKSTASSPSLPLYPGPLTPHPPLSSPQPQSLWRTVRKCVCALGSQLLNTGSQSDEGSVCSRIPYCLSPNMLCRVGLTARGKKTRDGNYFLVGEPFPQSGACIPAHKVCDGMADCLDRSDEVNCPQVCPEYECDNGMCLPFSSRCNDVIECDSDESCCGKDQFECRRPRHSLLLYHQYLGTPNSRCLPSALVCNGRPDCPDGWDEASCDESDLSKTSIGELDVKIGDVSSGNITSGSDSVFVEGSSKSSNGDFPYFYIIFIVSAIVVVLIIVSIVAYLCSRNWSKSSYTVQTDVRLIPTGKKRKGGHSGIGSVAKCAGDSMKGLGECQEALVGGKTTIKSGATLMGHVLTANSRSRRYIGGSSRRITSKLTVLPSPPVNDALDWYCPSCSSKGGAGGFSVQSPSVSKTYCSRCQKHSRRHSRNPKSSRTRSPCQCGLRVNDVGDNNSSVYWSSRGPSKCPPAPPPSSLPSPPPSPTTTSCLFDNRPSSNTCHPPPAPPPSKLHADDDDADEYGEELAGSSSTTPSCELSDSSSLTASPLRCRHSRHRRRRHRPSRHHHRHPPQRHEPSVSSVTSVDHSTYQYPATTGHRRSQHRAGSSRRLRRRKVSFRSDLNECAGHCPQCGSRQQHRPHQGSSSRKRIMRRNTFATTATAAVQQHTLVATFNSRVQPASNTIESSTSSSGCHKTNSNHSSEFYPRETVNPPPSPITESIYASLPLSILKHPEMMSQNARLSNSSGSNGIVCHDGVNSLSFETLGNDKEHDRKLIKIVGNLDRSSVGASPPPFYCPPGEDLFGFPKQLQMPSSAVGGLATALSSSSVCLPSSRRLHHKLICDSGANDVGTTLAAVTASNAAKTTTTTTTIQNVHVVIVASNKEQQMHHHHHECCDCCSDYSLSSYSSESEGPSVETTPPPQFPALMISAGDPTPVIPEEPREQAEGAEADEEINPPARAPFAQFSKNA